MRTLTILLSLLLATYSWAANPEKLYKQATNEVWGIELAEFSPNADIPDELLKDNSAVIIASYTDIDVQRKSGNDFAKMGVFGSNVTNLITYREIRRQLVKLLDEKAIKEFSEFDITAGNELKIQNYPIYKVDVAIGARVYKKDGSMEEIDLSGYMSEAYKNKDNHDFTAKAMIPGLEIGDVLDIFMYQYETMDEFPLPEKRFILLDDYPVMKYMFKGTFSPELTVEYNSANGTPEAMIGTDEAKNNVAFLYIEGLEAMPATEFIRPYRQFPFMAFNIQNPNSEYIPHMSTDRKAGFYDNLPPATYLTDVLAQIRDNDTKAENDISPKVVKIIKDWVASHPDASQDQIIDAAWLATMYANSTNKNLGYSDRQLALTFRETLNKLGISTDNVGLGLVSSRNDASLQNMTSSDQPDFVALVNGKAYQSKYIANNIPGEFQGDYQGEEGLAIMDKPTSITLTTQFSPFTIPNSRANANSETIEITTSIIDTASESPKLKANVKATAIGEAKNTVGIPVEFESWCLFAEDFLGIAEKDRYKPEEQSNKADSSTKFMFDFGKKLFDSENIEVLNNSISSLGSTPDNPAVEFNCEYIVNGAIEKLSNGDLILSIGKIFGDEDQIEEKDRNRDFPAVLSSPFQDKRSITIDIPAGYEADLSSIEAANTNLSNIIGMQFLQCKINDEGKIDMNQLIRVNKNIIDEEHWTDFLSIIDKSAEIAELKIILRKK